jgi:hypothetical protein
MRKLALGAPLPVLAIALAVAAAPPALASPKGGLEDDYPGARALAQGRGVPLVVDVWAPW